MYAKLVLLTLLLVATFGGVLLLRQERLTLVHETTGLHGEVQTKRQAVWDAQTRTARILPPTKLRRMCEKAGVKLVPHLPKPGGAQPETERVRQIRQRLARSRGEGR